MKLNQTIIAKKLGVSQQFISAMLMGKTRPKWTRAVTFAGIVPNTSPEFFMTATPEELKKAMTSISKNTDSNQK